MRIFDNPEATCFTAPPGDLEAFMFPPASDAGAGTDAGGGGATAPAAVAESAPGLGARDFAPPAFPFDHHPARARAESSAGGLAVLEREAWAELDLPVEQAAPASALPPLQSVVELTTAYKPPTPTAAPVAPSREAAAADGAAAPAAAAPEEVFAVDALEEDGEGVLPDGTEYRRTSGEERGPEGFWKRWTKVEGASDGGAVRWTEIWWESSDWNGLKELGAEKTGCDTEGGAWREAWCEKLYVEAGNLQPTVSRTAHKWAQSRGGQGEPGGEEWEEQWTELYHKNGVTDKSAAKWAAKGGEEWHEAWGEKYDGGGAAPSGPTGGLRPEAARTAGGRSGRSSSRGAWAPNTGRSGASRAAATATRGSGGRSTRGKAGYTSGAAARQASTGTPGSSPAPTTTPFRTSDGTWPCRTPNSC